MKSLLVSIFCLTLLNLCNLQARVVTLVVNNGTQPGAVITTNFLSIASNEVATVVAAGPTLTDSPYQCEYRFVIGGVVFDNFGDLRNFNTPIAGPAQIHFWAEHVSTGTGASYGYITVEITPESFPPDKTIILPEGTVGTVYIESSTNLVAWQEEWSQTFSNANENRFFRLRAERSLP